MINPQDNIETVDGFCYLGSWLAVSNKDEHSQGSGLDSSKQAFENLEGITA